MNPCSVLVLWHPDMDRAIAALAVAIEDRVFARSGRGEWWRVRELKPGGFAPVGYRAQPLPFMAPTEQVRDRARVMKFEAALSASKIYRPTDRMPLALLGQGGNLREVLA